MAKRLNTILWLVAMGLIAAAVVEGVVYGHDVAYLLIGALAVGIIGHNHQ